MKKLIAGAIAAVGSFAVTRLVQRKQPEKLKVEDGEGNFMWISADDVKVYEPVFGPDESVVTWNPYTEDYAIVDLDFTPLYYSIEDVKFDDNDMEFRYKLAGEDEWFAESWLMKPVVPFMSKELKETEEGDDMHQQLGDEGKAKQVQIDYWLLTLHEAIEAGDEKERKAAEEALKELTGGERA